MIGLQSAVGQVPHLKRERREGEGGGREGEGGGREGEGGGREGGRGGREITI